MYYAASVSSPDGGRARFGGDEDGATESVIGTKRTPAGLSKLWVHALKYPQCVSVEVILSFA
jgi:hypothetical protein